VSVTKQPYPRRELRFLGENKLKKKPSVLEAAIGSRRDFSIGVTDSKIFTLLFPEAFQKPSVNAFFA
jgi:hypothetical protein